MSSKKALLIIDIQNDYFEGGAHPLVGAFEASLNAKQILESFRSQNELVVHIQHISTRNDATFFKTNTQGVEIHQHVKPVSGEKLIVKHYPNSFRETELLDFLKEQKISELIICGMMTNMCVDATVRAAKDYGFECTLIGDACAAATIKYAEAEVKGEDVQSAFLGALSYFYATVVSTETYSTLDKIE